MSERLCLLTVHAHPDDEASKGPATVAKYSASGVHTVLVTCTGGEEGEVLNPSMDRPEVREDLQAVRARELEAAAGVIGYDEVRLLGYRDSGMPGTEANGVPTAFVNAPIEEAVGRLVRIVRSVRPQVMIGYGDDHNHYPHPDHIRAHEIAVAAFERAGDPDAYEGCGEPYQPLKLYYVVWSAKRIIETHERLLELGLESPYDETWFERANSEQEITTSIDISDFADVRREALLAHATQIDPTSKYWFALPAEEARRIHPFDDYVLARSLVQPVTPESDLFSGLRTSVSA